MMETSEVMKILPQKPPFLMVDKIVEVIPGKKAVGIKALGANEPYFDGHFPGNPVLPGVLQIEAINQVGEIALLCDEKFKGTLAFVTGCNNVRFKRPILPGDVVTITTEVLDSESKIGAGRGKIEKDGQVVCEADLSFFMQR